MLEGANQWVAFIGGVIAIIATFIGWRLLFRSPITVTLFEPLDEWHNTYWGVKILNRSSSPVTIAKGEYVMGKWLRLPLLVGGTEEDPYSGEPLANYRLEPSEELVVIADDRYSQDVADTIAEVSKPDRLKTGWAEIKHTLRAKPLRSKKIKRVFFTPWIEENAIRAKKPKRTMAAREYPPRPSGSSNQ